MSPLEDGESAVLAVTPIRTVTANPTLTLTPALTVTLTLVVAPRNSTRAVKDVLDSFLPLCYTISREYFGYGRGLISA